MVDKYLNASPYVYCNGNPLKYVDPDGMYFDDVNEKKAQEISSNIQAQMKGTIGGRRKELKQSLQDIEDMRNDADYEYQFLATNDDRAKALGINENQPQTGKGLSKEDNANKNANGHQVIGMFYIAKDDGSLLHEARHGGQHARREMNVLTKEGYSLASEVDAYRAQWGWSGILDLPILHAQNLSRNITIEYRYEIDESLIRQITEDLTNPTLIYQSLTK